MSVTVYENCICCNKNSGSGSGSSGGGSSGGYPNPVPIPQEGYEYEYPAYEEESGSESEEAQLILTPCYTSPLPSILYITISNQLGCPCFNNVPVKLTYDPTIIPNKGWVNRTPYVDTCGATFNTGILFLCAGFPSLNFTLNMTSTTGSTTATSPISSYNPFFWQGLFIGAGTPNFWGCPVGPTGPYQILATVTQ